MARDDLILSPFVVSLSNHEYPGMFILRQAQDERKTYGLRLTI